MKVILEPRASEDFYRHALDILGTAGIPFMVGGAFALRVYTGVVRDTKDFDLFLRRADLGPALEAFRRVGYRAKLTFSHWLAKVHHGELFVDLIFRAGNGLCDIDDSWFRDAGETELMGKRVALVPPEEMIWQKAYIQERERFDGADVAHLLRSCAERMDWRLLVERFGPDWRVLFGHLLMFGFVYPAERSRVPPEIMAELTERLRTELAGDAPQEPVCRGTLLSRAQYLPDVERWGYRDARLEERCRITPEEIQTWTDEIGKEDRPWD